MGNELAGAGQPMVGSRIKVVGVGRGACKVMAHMLGTSMHGAEFISVNSDAQMLAACPAQTRLQLGRGGRSIARADKAREAALDEIDRIRDAIGGASMVVVVACLGLATGCGAAPVIARAAKDMGMLTLTILTTPFEFEGPRRMEFAREAIATFEGAADALFVFDNESMIEELGDDVSQDEAFVAVDQLRTSAVRSLVSTNQGQRWSHAYEEDLRAVMQTPGTTWWGTATAEGFDRPQAAVADVIKRSRSAGVDLAKARGMLINIAAAASSMKQNEPMVAQTAFGALASVTAQLASTVHVDESLGDRLRLTVWATGL